MQALSKTLVLLLLAAALISAPLAAQVLLPEASSHERPAACHEDGGSVPTPEPASHSCCEGGHDFAILQHSPTLPSPLQLSAQVDFIPHSVAVAEPNGFLSFVIVSGDPPITSPLRV
jgi:hypothetical protein